MSGQDLKIVKQHPYLGVIIDHQLSWKLHVDYVRDKAMKPIGFLNRNLLYVLVPERVELQTVCATHLWIMLHLSGTLTIRAISKS